MTFIRTVSGDISPEDLGVMYAHDHIYSDPPYWKEVGDEDLLINDLEASAREVEEFRAEGGGAIYEATAIDGGRDPEGLRMIANRTGVNIIATAGFIKEMLWRGTMPGTSRTYNDWIAETSRADLRDHVVAEIRHGIEGTDVRGGVAKFGTGYNMISENEDKVMRTVMDAHKETGCPLHSHTEMGTLILEQLAVLKSEGVDPTRLTIAHVDRNPDPWLHRKAAEIGATLCFDGISRVKYNPDSVPIDCILNLVRHGHEKQIVVGGDIARRTMFRHYGKGGLGLRHILRTWVPRFIEQAGEAGFDGQALIHTFMVENPKRAYSFS